MHQLLDEKIVRLRVVGIANAFCFCWDKAGFAVKQDIACNRQCADSHFFRFFHGVVEQLLSIALPLVCGGDADRTKGHDRHGSPVVAVDFRPHIDDLPNQLTVQLHDEVQLRHKCRVIPIAVQHIVLHAAGAVDIPEGLAGQVFNGTVIVFGFQTNGDLLF